MTGSVGTLTAILVLSLAVWTLFSLFTPDTPLSPPETFVVVGVCAAAVLGGKWIWSRLRKARGSDEQTR